jgi:diguanylate cyclase (GGDEF)-like protein
VPKVGYLLMVRLVLAMVVLSIATFVAPTPARAAPPSSVTVFHAPATPAIVVGPATTEHMTVRAGSFEGTAGLETPLGDAPLGHAVISVPLPRDLRPGTPILVRITPASAGRPHLIDDDPAIDDAVRAARAGGIMLGVLLAVFCLQLAGYVITRDPSIPWYAGLVVSLMLVELLRDGAFPGQRMPSLVWLAALDMATGWCTVGFVLTYLQLWTKARRTFWIVVAGLLVVGLFDVAVGIGRVLHGQTESVRSPVLFLGSLVLLGATLARLRTFAPARFLLLAQGTLLLGVSYRVLRTFTPLSVPFLDRWAFEIATVANALFFGVALIARWRYALHQREQLEVRLEDATRAAEHDALTGALNRRGLITSLENVTAGTLFYVDLDGFKLINDRYGHADGDAILVQVVRVLRTIVGPEATVARVGGDEFVVVVADEDRTRADRLVEQMCDAIALVKPGSRTRAPALSASIGYAPLTGLTLDNAMRIADANAYRVKAYKQALSSTSAG